MRHKHFELDYLDLVEELLVEGETRETRNGYTIAQFCKTLVIDMQGKNRLALLESRRMYPRGILGELAAFLRGPKTLADFESQGCNYWNKWSNPDGTINVDYGNLWLDFDGVNQLAELKAKLKSNPTDRRLIVSGWNPGNLASLNLPCCHMLYQWYVREGNYLDMIWYQRSADTMIGIPSDIVLAQVLNILLANEVGLKPGRVNMVFGDTHIYNEHRRTAGALTSRRQFLSLQYPVYELHMEPGQPIEEFTADMLTIHGYEPMAPMSFELKE